MNLPALFVSHGAPSLLLDGGPAADFLKSLGQKFPRPQAVLCLSAHWETRGPLFTASEKLETIHDFSGFPEKLYQTRYPVSGFPELAERAAALCRGAGVPAALEPKRGLDHGAWIPLMAMYPKADIPVVQVSLPFAQGPRGVFALGAALAPLRKEGVLLLASGGFTHNLRELSWGKSEASAPAQEFHAWTLSALREGRLEDLLEAPARAPHFLEVHPRMEHWLPLYFALGAAEPSWRCEVLYSGFEHGSLAMDAFAFSSASEGSES